MHRANKVFFRLAATLFILFALGASAFAQLSTRVLTIRTSPSDTVLKTVFVDGREANIISSQQGYTFVEIRDEVSNFRCKYTISVIAKNGPLLAQTI